MQERNQKETPASGWNFLSLLTHATARAFSGWQQVTLGGKPSDFLIWALSILHGICFLPVPHLQRLIDYGVWVKFFLPPASKECSLFFSNGWGWGGQWGSKRRITACKMWKLHEIKIAMSINKILLEPSHARLFTWCPWSWDRGCMPQTQSEKYFLSGPLWEKFVNPWTRRALRKGFEVYSQ